MSIKIFFGELVGFVAVIFVGFGFGFFSFKVFSASVPVCLFLYRKFMAVRRHVWLVLLFWNVYSFALIFSAIKKSEFLNYYRSLCISHDHLTSEICNWFINDIQIITWKRNTSEIIKDDNCLINW